MPAATRMLALALAAAAAACAHDDDARISSLGPMTYQPAPAPERITRYADENRDGKVTREEAKVDPNLTRVFGHYDANDDGTLDRAEFARLESDSREAAGEYTYMTPAAPLPEVPPSPATPESGLNRTGIDEIRP